MNLHKKLVENQDRIEEVFFTWLWTTLEEKVSADPNAIPFVSGDEILTASKYSYLNRKIQKSLIRAWKNFIESGFMYHDRSLQENFHWIGKNRLKKWRLSYFDSCIEKQS